MRSKLGRMEGTVLDFDADVGLGTIGVDDGRSWIFHCTAIADGSRQIAIGTAVGFELQAGGPGVWEAAHVTPMNGPEG